MLLTFEQAVEVLQEPPTLEKLPKPQVITLTCFAQPAPLSPHRSPPHSQKPSQLALTGSICPVMRLERWMAQTEEDFWSMGSFVNQLKAVKAK